MDEEKVNYGFGEIIDIEKIKLPKDHKYYCEDCEAKFINIEARCVNCGSSNVGIDEPIIRLPKSKT